MKWVFGVVLFALLACGSAEEKPAPPLDAAGRRQAFVEGFVWGGDGPEGDRAADMKACGAALVEPADPQASSLAQVNKALRCMKEKGWDYRPKGS